jgi:hypothetical protein
VVEGQNVQRLAPSPPPAAPQLLRVRVKNPCLSLKVVHAHCEMPSSFAPSKVGDRRLGKREVIQKIQQGLRQLGHTVTDDYRAVGAAKVNVTAD